MTLLKTSPTPYIDMKNKHREKIREACIKCNKPKNEQGFYFLPNSDKLRNQCKECMISHRQENKSYRKTNSNYMKSEKGRIVGNRANKKYAQKPEVVIVRRMNQRFYDMVKRFTKSTTSDETINRKAIEELYIRQNGLCSISKGSLENGYHIDHITPLSKGGSHNITNIQLLLPRINLYKSNKLNYEYVR